MQCYNRGFDGRDVQWECKADLEDLYRFGTTDVSCEGYAHKNDKYILAGSCGVEYTLYLTEKGKQYNKNKNRNTYDSRERFDSYQNDYEPERPSMVSKLVWMVVAGIFLYSMYTSCIQAAAGGRRNNGGAGARNTGSSGTGGGGGGGSGGFGGGPGFGGGGSGGGGSCNDPPMNSRPQTQGPGFWSGLGLGSLLGSMMNRPRYNTYNAYGGGGFGAGPSMRQRPPVYRSSSSSSSSSSSGPSTRTASGFGGTNRR
ncbi:hypothetical protein BDR26DRAFT_922260 [Obelidium mucronatum]|nr:hypothetical protein BDR26DRAFT_922260 [Obelidium mucronatum]